MTYLLVQKTAPDGKAPPPGWELVPSAGSAAAPACKSKDEKDKSSQLLQELTVPPLLRAPRARPMLSLRREKHEKHGALDVYQTVLSAASGATSDGSGSLPGYWNVAQITNTSGWSTFAVDFDLVRLKKVVFRFLPKLGWKTGRSYNPLTVTACQVVRVWSDPDGALGAPSVAQALLHVPGSKRTLTRDHSLVDPFDHTYYPDKPITRFSSTAIRYTNLHDWADTGDLNSSTAMCVGGIGYNTLQAGACPASTDIFSVVLEFHVEFAIRAV